MQPFLRIQTGEDAQSRRRGGGRAGEVWADLRPVRAAVARLPECVRREVQRAWIDRREQHWLRANDAIVAAAQRLRSDLLCFASAPVVSRDLAAVDDVGVERIGRDVAVLLDANRMPFAEGDLPVVATTRYARRPALLLSTAHAIGIRVVRAHVIELRGRLVVPRAPRLAAVHGDDRALVRRVQDDLGIVGVDPQAMVVVATGSATKGGEGLPAIGRFPRDDIGDVHDVRILWIDAHFGEIRSATPQTHVGVDASPAFAGVIRSIDAAKIRRIDYSVETCGSARRRPEADAAEPLGDRRQPVRERMPRCPTIGGFVESARGAIEGAANLPRGLPPGPQHGVHRVRVAGVERNVERAGVLVAVEHFRPRIAAIGGAEDSTFRIRPVWMPEYGREHAIRIARIDDECGNLLTITKAEMRPVRTAVHGFVDAISRRQVGTLQSFTATDVNDIRCRGRDRDCADGAGRLLVEDGAPDAAVIRALPHATVVHADVKHVRLPRHADGRYRAPTPVRPDHSPAHLREGSRVGALRLQRARDTHDRQTSQRDASSSGHEYHHFMRER